MVLIGIPAGAGEPPTAELQTKGKTPADVLKQLGMKL